MLQSVIAFSRVTPQGYLLLCVELSGTDVGGAVAMMMLVMVLCLDGLGILYCPNCAYHYKDSR